MTTYTQRARSVDATRVFLAELVERRVERDPEVLAARAAVLLMHYPKDAEFGLARDAQRPVVTCRTCGAKYSGLDRPDLLH